MENFKTNNKSIWINKCEYIVLHHTATGAWTAKGVIEHFQDTKAKNRASAHYIVDENWVIYSMNTEKDILRHAGIGSLNWIVNNMNEYSIWIEVVGPLDWKFEFSDKQRVAVASLIKDIAKRNNITKEKVIRHKDYSVWRKVDIYDSFWNKDFTSRNDYVNSLFISEEDIKKSIQAKKVTEEVSKLRELTNSEDNKKILHDFNNRIRQTYKI